MFYIYSCELERDNKLLETFVTPLVLFFSKKFVKPLTYGNQFNNNKKMNKTL